MIEKKIYPCWAFQENGKKKYEINLQIYEDIKNKVEFVRDNKPTEKQLKEKAWIEYRNSGYAHKAYLVLSNPENLSNDELALICDSGNLCFGYRTSGNVIKIHTD